MTRRSERGGFTLLELLIVVTVLTIIMGLMFRLMGIGGDAWRRTLTVRRMQRLENCLSGYMAAFGSYPPVQLHGSRDIYLRVGAHGIQKDKRNENIWNWTKIGTSAENAAWRQVKAACMSQPVACKFPYPDGFKKKVDAISNEMAKRASSGDEKFKHYWKDEGTKAKLEARYDDGVTANIGRHNKNKDFKDWRNVQLFKFGLMSFLLPRYLVMMNGNRTFFEDYRQWTGNNVLPADPFDGHQFANWGDVKTFAASGARTDLARIMNIPSQAVCARWMANLQDNCATGHSITLFGVNISDEGGDLYVDNYDIEVFTPDSNSDSRTGQYVLDGVSVHDGWRHDLYYYSPPPYQRYWLWSAGKNNRTFAPWFPKEKLSSKANDCVSKWTRDDFMHLSH